MSWWQIDEQQNLLGDEPADAAEAVFAEVTRANGGAPPALPEVLTAVQAAIVRAGHHVLAPDQPRPARLEGERLDGPSIFSDGTPDERLVGVLGPGLERIAATYHERWARAPRLPELLAAIAFVLRDSDHIRDGHDVDLARILGHTP
jgi:hypothetical protein